MSRVAKGVGEEKRGSAASREVAVSGEGEDGRGRVSM